jgi:hypothetical protein
MSRSAWPDWCHSVICLTYAERSSLTTYSCFVVLALCCKTCPFIQSFCHVVVITMRVQGCSPLHKNTQTCRQSWISVWETHPLCVHEGFDLTHFSRKKREWIEIPLWSSLTFMCKFFSLHFHSTRKTVTVWDSFCQDSQSQTLNIFFLQIILFSSQEKVKVSVNSLGYSCGRLLNVSMFKCPFYRRQCHGCGSRYFVWREPNSICLQHNISTSPRRHLHEMFHDKCYLQRGSVKVSVEIFRNCSAIHSTLFVISSW